MKQRLLPLLLIVLVTVPAVAGTVTVVEDSSAASWSSAEYQLDNAVPSFQVCGTGFDGTVVFKQGLKSGKLVATRTLTLSGYTGCTEYYQELPSTVAQFTGTRSAGTVTVYLDWYKP